MYKDEPENSMAGGQTAHMMVKLSNKSSKFKVNQYDETYKLLLDCYF